MYIDTNKLKAHIQYLIKKDNYKLFDVPELLSFIDSNQQEQPINMIQWTGNNLKEVIDFTGKSPRFGEWFKSWEEYENYVHTHNNILKLFCEDGSHYEVPVGAWIVKTPDGYNVPSVAKYIQQKQSSLPSNLDEAAWGYFVKTFGIDNIAISEDIKRAVKFGAGWMAEQGYTQEGIARPDDDEIWINLKNTDIKDGDKVIVQIRKK